MKKKCEIPFTLNTLIFILNFLCLENGVLHQIKVHLEFLNNFYILEIIKS